MPPRDPTLKQKVFKFLVENNFDAPPTVREICTAIPIKSTSTAYKILKELEADGLINMASGKRRNLSLAGSTGSVRVPLLGTVAAGVPILANQSIEDYVTYDTNTSGDGLFALRVKGLSMKDAGILDGDIIIAKSQQAADDGEIVVALIGDEATVKTLSHEGGHIWLLPANPDFQPIPGDEASILGKVKAVIRHYEG